MDRRKTYIALTIFKFEITSGRSSPSYAPANCKCEEAHLFKIYTMPKGLFDVVVFG